MVRSPASKSAPQWEIAGKAELVVPTDAELLQVIESLRDEAGNLTAARRRWYDTLRLMALLGLRPIELLHSRSCRPCGCGS
jgi:integrase